MEVDETYAAFSATSNQNGRTLKVTSRAEVRRRQIPPDGYPGFRKAMNAVRDFGNLEFHLTKEGK